MDVLVIIAGILFMLVGSLSKTLSNHYEEKQLPKLSEKEQQEYWDNEKMLSKKGAYNIPFKGGSLISTNNNKYEFYNSNIVVGMIGIALGIIIHFKGL